MRSFQHIPHRLILAAVEFEDGDAAARRGGAQSLLAHMLAHTALLIFFFMIALNNMKRIIQFQIYKGEKQYVAQGVDIPVVTQAPTLDELANNIQEATALHLEDENPIELGFAPEPSVLVNFELPQNLSAHV